MATADRLDSTRKGLADVQRRADHARGMSTDPTVTATNWWVREARLLDDMAVRIAAIVAELEAKLADAASNPEPF